MKKIIEDLEKFAEENNINYTKIAKAMNIGSSTLSEYKKGTYTGDVKALTASAMNCEDVNTQTIILRNISAFVRIVGIYRNQYKNNEEFQALAIALEDQIYEVRNALTDRNFFRERATRLYGVARADLDY